MPGSPIVDVVCVIDGDILTMEDMVKVEGTIMVEEAGGLCR